MYADSWKRYGWASALLFFLSLSLGYSILFEGAPAGLIGPILIYVVLGLMPYAAMWLVKLSLFIGFFVMDFFFLFIGGKFDITRWLLKLDMDMTTWFVRESKDSRSSAKSPRHFEEGETETAGKCPYEGKIFVPNHCDGIVEMMMHPGDTFFIDKNWRIISEAGRAIGYVDRKGQVHHGGLDLSGQADPDMDRGSVVARIQRTGPCQVIANGKEVGTYSPGSFV